MPLERSRDQQGSFFRYGRSGKKYYYTPKNKQSRDNAKEEALRQARAIYYNKNHTLQFK